VTRAARALTAAVAAGALGAAALLSGTPGALRAQAGDDDARAAAAPADWALRDVTCWPGDGEGPRRVNLVVRDGRIAALGPGASIPAGMPTASLPEGAVLTAGLVGVGVPLGLVEISLEPSTRDLAPGDDDADPVRAAFAAADGYNPRSTLIPVARMEGVTSAVVAPVGGLVAGTSAWVDLVSDPAAAGVRDDAVALHVDLGDGGADATGGARPSALGRLREVFAEAALYRRRRADYDRRRLRELSVSAPDLERLAAALAGELPVVVHASRADQLVRVVDLARELELDLVLAGAEEGHIVADRLAAAKVPVLVHPLTNLPQRFSRLGAAYENAARLERAGVPVMIAAEGPHELRNLRQEAGNAIAAGLSREGALAAVTRRPAEVFGQGSRVGTLAPGREANLVVWDGDPFEVTTSAVLVSIGGVPQALRSRQTALFERYRDLDGVRRGRPR